MNRRSLRFRMLPGGCRLFVVLAVALLSTPTSAQQSRGAGPGIDDPLGAGLQAAPTSARGEVTQPTAAGILRVDVPAPLAPGSTPALHAGGAPGDPGIAVLGEGSLTTLFASNNGAAGNTFDLTPVKPLTLIAMDINLLDAGGAHSVTTWWRLGTAVGHEGSSVGWRVLSSTSGITSGGLNVPTQVPLFALTMLPGQTYGIYVDLQSYPSTTFRYTNSGPTLYSNADLSLLTNDGRGSPAFTGGGFYPREWNGTVYYNFAGPYVLDAYGKVNPGGSGHAPAIPTPYFGFDIARDLEFLRVSGFYVLDGFGGLHAGDGAPSLNPRTPYFGFDIAKDLEVTLQCYFSPGGTCQYYVLDGFGGVHPGGGAAPLSPPTPYFGFDAAEDLEFFGTGAYVLDAFGGVHAGNGAPVLTPATPYFGFDAARDLELSNFAVGYYVLDKYGGVHAGGGALPMAPPTPYFGFDVAQDLELLPGGFYVLDKYGGLHAGGGAPKISPAPAYFGFNAARDLEFR